MQRVDLRSPKVAATCRHPLEAEMFANELRANGIDAQTTNTTISGGAIEFALIDAEVLVPYESLEQAQQIIARLRKEQSNIDWNQVDVGERSTENSHSTNQDHTTDEIQRLRYPQGPPFGLWLAVEVIGVLALLIWAAS